jgi:gamma-glutamyltranspeptidase/glutathione hydrolase
VSEADRHSGSGRQGVVVAESELVAQAGQRILRQGGNAFDAAAATCLACAMRHPDKNGVGGYLLTGVVIEGASGRVWSLDSNSRAPAAAHAEMYEVRPVRDGPRGTNENEYDCSVADNANVHGPLAVGVPGQLAGIGALWERWGRLEWAEIVQPSLDLLADGFAFGEALSRSIGNLEAVIRRYPATAAHLLPGGRVPAVDDVWHRPDMERTLERLAKAGWRDFYDGELGREIADSVSAAGGALSRQDMADFHPRITEPYRIAYRDAEVFGAILPNGPLSILQALNMLACFDPVPDSDVRYWHRMTEVLKRTWRDRLQYLADPDYVDVPIERLLSPEFAAGRAQDLLRFPDYVDDRPFAAGGAVPETSHVSTADGSGNVVSATITQGGGFGSLFTVPGRGIILGHGMCRLDPRPGLPNSVAGGKRPLNNVMAMALRLPGRDIALGMPGGRRIIAVGTQMASRLVDFDATPEAATRAPRMHVTGAEPLELQETADDGIAAELEHMGHGVVRVAGVGGNAAAAEVARGGGPVRGGGGGWALGL